MTSEKPILYLLPGLLCDETVWSPQVAALESQFDIRIPDFSDFDSLSAMAASVVAGSGSRFSVAGHSMGARAALEVFRQAPERVERLALLDTGTHPPQDGERQKREALLALAQTEGMAALAARWLPPMVHPDRNLDHDFMASLYAMVERKTPVIFRNQIEALLGRPDAQPLLGAIGCPVLVGVGRQDGWSPPAQHEEIAAAISQSRYIVFEESGHMSPVEAPDAVTSALRDWMHVSPA